MCGTVVQQAGDKEFKILTVWVRIPPVLINTHSFQKGSKMASFSIFTEGQPEDNDEQMQEFYTMMDQHQDDTYQDIAKLAQELCITEGEAANVWYLRTRSRHTPELEKRLIQEMKDGVVINMCEWP
jgi:hypothetical protein